MCVCVDVAVCKCIGYRAMPVKRISINFFLSLFALSFGLVYLGELNELIDENDGYDKDSVKKHLTDYGIGHQRHTQNNVQR